MRKILAVDLDETLVYSRSRKPFDGCTTFTDPSDGYICHTIARPGAKEFLQEIRDRDIELIAVTQGIVEFQIQVLKKLSLFRYFMDDFMTGKSIVDYSKHQVYGYTNYNRSRASEPDLAGCKWVMLDNLSHNDRTLEDKMIWLGERFDPDKNFVRCEEYYGYIAKPRDLRELIPRIEELLNK